MFTRQIFHLRNNLYIGPAPGIGPFAADLKAREIQTVVSLVTDFDMKYFGIREEAVDEVEKLGMTLVRVPFQDMTTPDRKLAEHIVEEIVKAEKNGKVYLHCIAGKGRTGCIAGAYLNLICDMNDGEKILEELRRAREVQDCHITGEQCEWVRKFPKRD